MKSEKVLDAKGLACPMPIVRTKKAMDQLESGQILEIHTTDKGSTKDIPAWADAANHEILKTEQDGEVFKFWVKKA
ncbi:sulfurtransferase TusA family protein [Bacillus sp. REN3]|uniref:sulfurtransferase TusA family protein n=1 Tax=Bacillus sp. REN3 TaxID=2802440 RepID=UPI001AEE92A2|nr:sulfurtransferase TusA family protein [Bacillus sp. REN3]